MQNQGHGCLSDSLSARTQQPSWIWSASHCPYTLPTLNLLAHFWVRRSQYGGIQDHCKWASQWLQPLFYAVNGHHASQSTPKPILSTSCSISFSVFWAWPDRQHVLIVSQQQKKNLISLNYNYLSACFNMVPPLIMLLHCNRFRFLVMRQWGILHVKHIIKPEPCTHG